MLYLSQRLSQTYCLMQITQDSVRAKFTVEPRPRRGGLPKYIRQCSLTTMRVWIIHLILHSRRFTVCLEFCRLLGRPPLSRVSLLFFLPNNDSQSGILLQSGPLYFYFQNNLNDLVEVFLFSVRFLHLSFSLSHKLRMHCSVT